MRCRTIAVPGFAALALGVSACAPDLAYNLDDDSAIAFDTSSAEDGGADPLLGAASAITAGTFVLPLTGADVTLPTLLDAPPLSALGLAPYLLVEVSAVDGSAGTLSLLTAWGENAAAMAVATPRQSDGPTTSCSGSKAGPSYASSCDSMWTDMSTTYLGPVLTAPGATLRAPTLSGEISTSGGTPSMSDVTLSGALDLRTLTDDLGVSTLALCLSVGGCDVCPGTTTRACTSLELSGLSGDLNAGLDLTPR